MSDPNLSDGALNCSVVAELLEAFHNGNLNPGAAESVRQHLDKCTSCSVRLGAVQRNTGAPDGIEDGDAVGVRGRTGQYHNGTDGRRSNIPKPALLAIGLAVVVLPASAWVLGTRLLSDEHVHPDMPSVVALRGVGDDEVRTAAFSVSQPTNLRVYAIGEGQAGEMFDFGVITDARTRRPIWKMEYRDTEHAGGGNKNRMVDLVLPVRPGDYLVQYRSDDSHSYDDWNTSPPNDEESWGITVSLVDADDIAFVQPHDLGTGMQNLEVSLAEATARIAESAVNAEAIEEYAQAIAQRAQEVARARSERAFNSVVARLVEVGDDAHLRTTFSLDRATRIRVYALGESTFGEMHDYAWIEDANSGEVVWEMTIINSIHAGGASKNRLFEGLIHLDQGDYVLVYKSDDSHSYDNWNDDEPSDAANYGVTLYREGR